MDFIITNDLHQGFPIRNYWVFKPKQNSIDYLVQNFWFSSIQCYELHQVMRQTNEHFMNILNKYHTFTHIENDISTLNAIRFKMPPNDLQFPYLYYTNKTTNIQNEYVFQHING